MSCEADELSAGFEILCAWSRNIAMLPLEEWREAISRAESAAPFIDPTLFKEYLGSVKPEILKDVLDAAIKLKAVVIKHQPTIRDMKTI